MDGTTMKTHLMIDLETMGTSPNAVVLSCGLVLFNRERVILEDERTLSIYDQLVNGRSISKDTAEWWKKQSPEAQKVIADSISGGVTLPEFYDWLEAFLGASKSESQSTILVWSNGANFDIPIVEDICFQIGKPVPWKFWNTRCYRTLKTMFHLEHSIKREGVSHRALDDAKYQAKCVAGYLAANPMRDA